MIPLAGQCVVEIGGARYSSRAASSLLECVTLDLTADKTSEAEISFADPDFAVTDLHLDATGLPNLSCRVWMAYGDQLGEPWFKGTLAGHEHDGRVARFRFHDQGSKMKREKKARFHNGKTDFDVMRALAEEYGLSCVVLDDAPDSAPHASLIQRGKSDWDFARTIARRSGARIWVEGDTLFVQEAGKHGASIARLKYRDDFLMMLPAAFSYRLPENRRGRHRSVHVHARGSAGERLTGEVTSEDRGRVHQGVSEDLTHHTRAEATRRARAIRAHARETAFEHRVRLVAASPVRITLRSVITLAGCGDFYSGEYVVHALRKEWRKGSVQDELTLRRDLGKQKTAPARSRARR
jgi:phage protein D